MSTEGSEEEKDLIRSALVVEPKAVLGQLLDRIKTVVVLDQAGRAHPRLPKEALTDAQLLTLHLIGRKFAHAVGLTPRDSMSADDLVKATAIPYATVTGRAAGLKRKGWIESDERGEYRIVYVAIEEILNDLQRKTGGSKP